MSPIVNQIPASSIRSAVALGTEFEDFRTSTPILQQRLYVIGQGATLASFSEEKFTATSSGEVGDKVGYGSPLHLMARRIFPADGLGAQSVEVTFFPLLDHASGVAATWTVTVSGATQTETKSYVVRINDMFTDEFSIPAGTTAAVALDLIKAAIDAKLESPVTIVNASPIMTFTAKAEGTYGNDIDIEIIGDVSGLTYVVAAGVAGASDPSIAPAITDMGNVWYTMVANQFSNTAALDALKDEAEDRWSPLRHIPFVAALGDSDRSAADAIADARKTDRTNFYVLADGCKAFGFEIGARGVSRMVDRANTTPHRAYSGLQLTGLTPGADSAQPTYVAGDASQKKGVSTTIIANGVIELEDILTFYHPDDELPDPGYRYVVDVVKLQNVINSLDQKFNSDDWKGMTILGDDDISTQPDVRRPKDAKGAIFGLADNWVDFAWITDAAFTKENLVLVKATGVRNRFEGNIPVKITDSLRQQDYKVKFGFNIT